MKSILLLIVIAAFSCSGIQPATFEYFVSQNGNDAWSGRLAAPNTNGSDGPFATLEKARNVIRKMKATSGLPKGGITISIRGGIYQVAQTFTLTDQDAGLSCTTILPMTFQ